MICPRWLVQSSAVGVAAAALTALPLWLASPPPQEPGEGVEKVRVEVREVRSYEREAPRTLNVKEIKKGEIEERERKRELKVRNQRAREIRTHLYEIYEEPHCPAELRLEARGEAEEVIRRSLEEARTGVGTQ